MALPSLKVLPSDQYAGVDGYDPIRFYRYPIIGSMYRRRVEMCLAECRGGKRVLEVGFGSGVTFLNLHEMYTEIHGLDLAAQVDKVQAVFAARNIPVSLRNGNVVKMDYDDNVFDTVLLISILEHLKVEEQAQAFSEIRRVLKPGGQVVYGVPIERPLMIFAYRLMGYNIREHHFSTEKDVAAAAGRALDKVKITQMPGIPSFVGNVYEIGHFVKPQY